MCITSICSESPTTDDRSIWHPNEADNTPTITLYESRGNGFHLSAVVRKYTASRVTIGKTGDLRGKQIVNIEVSKLYDALGLLRSLQHDVALFNGVASSAQQCVPSVAEHATTKAIDDDEDNALRRKESAKAAAAAVVAARKYACFRLSRQAVSFGVRLPPAGTATVAVPGLDSLVAYVEHMHRDDISAAKANVDLGVVDFDSLQEYFVPGTELVDQGVATGLAGVPTLMRVRACYYSRGKSLMGVVSTFYAALECVVSLGDGKFAVVEAQFPQSEFQGTRSVTRSIDMFTRPTEKIVEALRLRGNSYQSICSGGDNVVCDEESDAHVFGASGTGVMVQYAAGTFIPTAKGSLRGGSEGSRTGSYGYASRSPGRMMVDTTSAWARGVQAANANGIACDAVVSCLKYYAQKRSVSAAAAAQKESKHDGASSAAGYNTAAVNADWDDGDMLVLSAPLPLSLLALSWPVVPGFSLDARTWGVATVSGLSPVRFNERAFEDVVMPPARKKLIRALVMSHDLARRTGQRGGGVDLIAGKGEGSIFLLHGPPGVGKTLTAEAIAEFLQKPLYVVSMGELGTSPEALEDRLRDILDLCVPWGALVLIDEAEMLLERRTKDDLVRNAMVCVMLRLLEYYTGILFLTTNRVESLDPSFQSRVSCALRYEALSADYRRDIWLNALRRLGVTNIIDKDQTVQISGASVDKGGDGINVSELARCEINGRQIKNALQLAAALSEHDGVKLTMEHLRTTLEITQSFLEESLAKMK